MCLCWWLWLCVYSSMIVVVMTLYNIYKQVISEPHKNFLSDCQFVVQLLIAKIYRNTRMQPLCSVCSRPRIGDGRFKLIHDDLAVELRVNVKLNWTFWICLPAKVVLLHPYCTSSTAHTVPRRTNVHIRCIRSAAASLLQPLLLLHHQVVFTTMAMGKVSSVTS